MTIKARGGSNAQWKKNILNFHFDYLNPSLKYGVKLLIPKIPIGDRQSS